MSSKAELYAEIGQLKSLIEQLQREAVKVPKLEEELKTQMSDASFFKTELDKANRLREQAEKSLRIEREGKKKLKHSFEEVRHAQAEAEKQVHRLKSDLHYDKLAREGQVKRARIMEHELTEVKHDIFLQTKVSSFRTGERGVYACSAFKANLAYLFAARSSLRSTPLRLASQLRSEAEFRAEKGYTDLQKERSMRMQDIHERNKVMIAKQQSERNERLAEFSRFQVTEKASILETKVGGLEAAVKSQTKIIALNDVELNSSLAEIEVVKLESQRLKNEILKRDDKISHHVEIRKDLEMECHRLTTELMATAQTHSER